ncbi:hypothetical protein [Methylocella sp.]|uniref:hypothetical protein n=1 Tax=Methylocella sp. TaxID=1978226 RepID=UPI0037833BD1
MVLKLPPGAKVGRFDGEPVVFVRSTGVWLRDGAWTPDVTGEVFHEGAVMSVEAFNKRWPSLPPLPESMFQLSGKRSETAE